MENSQEKTLSKLEKNKLKIDRLKAKIHKEEARLKQNIRKERNGQLIAFGVFVEAYLKKIDDADRAEFVETMKLLLTGRTLERALAGVKRISDEMASRKEEISPEPPSQLPAAEATEKSQGSA